MTMVSYAARRGGARRASGRALDAGAVARRMCAAVTGGVMGVGAGSQPRGTVWWWAAGFAVVTCLSGGGPHAILPAAQLAPAQLHQDDHPVSDGVADRPISTDPDRPVPSAQPARGDYLLIVTGASGAPEFATRFDRTATTLMDALLEAGVPTANVVWLAEDPERTGGRATARSTRAELEKALVALAGRVRDGDQLLILLVGHGSHEGADARINLPGPDITAAELASALTPLSSARVAVVNAASASGDFLPVLSARGRIVVTATKSSMERNETRFPELFASAFADAAGDVDKDGRVSLLEAFNFARVEVARRYESERHLLTEHAQLDDDGDGRGTPEPTTSGDGALARAFVLGGRAPARTVVGANPASRADADPRAVRLVAERDSLQNAVATLRARKDDMDGAAYEHELERLLVELAERTRALRALEGTRP